MDTGAELGWIGQVGGWAGMVALTALLFWMLATGRLYTKSQHDSIVSLHKDRFTTTQEALEITMAQNTALIEGGHTAQEFFEKVPVKTGSTRAVEGKTRKTGSGEEDQ